MRLCRNPTQGEEIKKGDCAVTILTVTATVHGVMKEQITKRLVKP